MSNENAFFVWVRHALNAAETSGTCAASSIAASAAASAMSVVGARVSRASTLPWRFFCNAHVALWWFSGLVDFEL